MSTANERWSLKRRNHNVVKHPRKGRSHDEDAAWKNHKHATPMSRLALCVIYCVVMYRYYGEVEIGEADLRPERIGWVGVVDDLLRCMPELRRKPLFTRRDGRPFLFTSLDVKAQCSRVSGRWGNFFHVYKPDGVKMWSIKDTEHPTTNKELLPLLAKARALAKKRLSS